METAFRLGDNDRISCMHHEQSDAAWTITHNIKKCLSGFTSNIYHMLVGGVDVLCFFAYLVWCTATLIGYPGSFFFTSKQGGMGQNGRIYQWSYTKNIKQWTTSIGKPMIGVNSYIDWLVHHPPPLWGAAWWGVERWPGCSCGRWFGRGHPVPRSFCVANLHNPRAGRILLYIY